MESETGDCGEAPLVPRSQALIFLDPTTEGWQGCWQIEFIYLCRPRRSRCSRHTQALREGEGVGTKTGDTQSLVVRRDVKVDGASGINSYLGVPVTQ